MVRPPTAPEYGSRGRNHLPLLPATAYVMQTQQQSIADCIAPAGTSDSLLLDFQFPITQIALDYRSTSEALEMAAIAVEAGFDWLEVGTPLVTCQGLAPVRAVVDAFPSIPVVVDYKTMDGGSRNVRHTKEEGAQVMTVCANASDATILSAITTGKELGVDVVVDTIGSKDKASRARQCHEWGAALVYLHYSADERSADPTGDSLQWLPATLDATSGPVGVSTFGVQDAVRAARMGADYFIIGHPLTSANDPLNTLKEYVEEVKGNYCSRH